MSPSDPAPESGGDEDVVEAELIEEAAPEGGSPVDDAYPDITTDADDVDVDLVEAVEIAQKYEAERDEYLDMARRVQAEFENYKRRVEQQRIEQRERAAESLVHELLPVLDAGEAAVAQGLEDVAPLHSQLLGALEKQGLSAVLDAEVEFDPNIHEAVMHEEGDGDAPVVAEVLRTGYLWNQRVIRPAMVKVRS